MHHQRRRSGNASVADLRKLTTASSDPVKNKRPGMTRRHTPSNQHRLGRGHREKDDSWATEEGESFPQYCMTCEKQFVPSDDILLYCSDSCRRVDQNSAPVQAVTVRSYSYTTTPTGDNSAYGRSVYSMEKPKPRDIVPRASPSRPTSMHLSNSPPASPGTAADLGHVSMATWTLRSLNGRPPSPPSPTSSSSVWPFGRSAAASLSGSSSLSSYSRPPTTMASSSSGPFSSSSAHVEDAHRHRHRHSDDRNAQSQPHSHETGQRPLPSRRPSGNSRSRRIELVTPLLSR